MKGLNAGTWHRSSAGGTGDSWATDINLCPPEPPSCLLAVITGARVVPDCIFSQSEQSTGRLRSCSSWRPSTLHQPGARRAHFEGALCLRNAEGTEGPHKRDRKKEEEKGRGRGKPMGLTFGQQSQEVMTQFSLRKRVREKQVKERAREKENENQVTWGEKIKGRESEKHIDAKTQKERIRERKRGGMGGSSEEKQSTFGEPTNECPQPLSTLTWENSLAVVHPSHNEIKNWGLIWCLTASFDHNHPSWLSLKNVASFCFEKSILAFRYLPLHAQPTD